MRLAIYACLDTGKLLSITSELLFYDIWLTISSDQWIIFFLKLGRKEGKPLCGFPLPHLLDNYFPLKFSCSFHSEPISTLPRQDHWLQFMWTVLPKCITCTKIKMFLTLTVSWWILNLHLCSSVFFQLFFTGIFHRYLKHKMPNIRFFSC